MVKPPYFLMRPRYLRAIPSLVVLTTAMAWGVASEPDVLDVVNKRAGVTLVQGAEDDLIVPAFLNRELAGLIPHAKLQMLPTGGHMYPITRTDAFVTALTEFAKSCQE